MIPVIEQAILDRLKASFPTFHVDGFPDDADGYDRLPFQHGVILFAYTDSDFGPPETLGMITQTQTAQFELHLVVKDLRTHDGAYAHLSKIRELLTGFTVPGAQGLYPLSEKFLNVKQHRWAYGQTWACQLTHVELVADATDPPYNSAKFVNPNSGHTLEVLL